MRRSRRERGPRRLRVFASSVSMSASRTGPHALHTHACCVGVARVAVGSPIATAHRRIFAGAYARARLTCARPIGKATDRALFERAELILVAGVSDPTTTSSVRGLRLTSSRVLNADAMVRRRTCVAVGTSIAAAHGIKVRRAHIRATLTSAGRVSEATHRVGGVCAEEPFGTLVRTVRSETSTRRSGRIARNGWHHFAPVRDTRSLLGTTENHSETAWRVIGIAARKKRVRAISSHRALLTSHRTGAT